jgi:hypothetical protein
MAGASELQVIEPLKKKKKNLACLPEQFILLYPTLSYVNSHLKCTLYGPWPLSSNIKNIFFLRGK